MSHEIATGGRHLSTAKLVLLFSSPLGARTLLGARGLTTRSKKLLGTKGIATRSKDAIRLEAIASRHLIFTFVLPEIQSFELVEPRPIPLWVSSDFEEVGCC